MTDPPSASSAYRARLLSLRLRLQAASLPPPDAVGGGDATLALRDALLEAESDARAMRSSLRATAVALISVRRGAAMSEARADAAVVAAAVLRARLAFPCAALDGRRRGDDEGDWWPASYGALLLVSKGAAAAVAADLAASASLPLLLAAALPLVAGVARAVADSAAAAAAPPMPRASCCRRRSVTIVAHVALFMTAFIALSAVRRTAAAAAAAAAAADAATVPSAARLAGLALLSAHAAVDATRDGSCSQSWPRHPGLVALASAQRAWRLVAAPVLRAAALLALLASLTSASGGAGASAVAAAATRALLSTLPAPACSRVHYRETSCVKPSSSAGSAT